MAWYEDFFGDDYLAMFAPHLPAERTQAEVDGVEALLGLAPGARILDLCCGQGRHAISLAARGYAVTGFDASGPLLERARDDARHAGVEVDWAQGDVRELDLHGFDGVVNLFNSFGYLESQADDQRMLDRAAAALAPGGLLLQEVANRDALLAAWAPVQAFRHDDCLVIEEHHFDVRTSRHEVDYTIVDGAGRREHSQSVRLYTVPELVEMHEAAGLHVETVTGGLDGGEVDLDGDFVVLRGRKAG